MTTTKTKLSRAVYLQMQRQSLGSKSLKLKQSLLLEEEEDAVEGLLHFMLYLLHRFGFYLVWLRFFFFF